MIPNLFSLDILLIGLLGLMVGSFLNVVIYRLPISLNLALPRSFCPQCHQPIRSFDNIPILSYLLLLGRCRHCQKKISLRYPLIEIFTCFLSIIIVLHFNFSAATLPALLITWALIVLALIDLEHTILPDNITLPFLWLGLFLSIFSIFQNSESCILGAILGYLILWSIFWTFKILTGKEGLGYGDFKLLAMLGAWLGWQALPFIILISSAIGSLIGFYLIIFRGKNRNYAIPFGPFLAVGGWLSLIWQNDFLRFYFKLVNL